VAQSIAAYVDTALDDAEIGPLHRRVFAIVTAGLFFDVIDFIILSSLVPDMIRTHFASPAEIGTVGLHRSSGSLSALSARVSSPTVRGASGFIS